MSRKCIAVWTQDEDGAPRDFEVHINFWRLEKNVRNIRSSHKSTTIKKIGDGFFSSKKFDDHLEIGVLIESATINTEVNIYVPLPIEMSHIRDCSDYFAIPELAQSIFNETITVENSGNSSSILKLKKHGQTYVNIYKFDKEPPFNISEQELILTRCNTGTRIKIPKKIIVKTDSPEDDRKNTYIRIRISLAAGNPFVDTITPYDKRFQSGREEIDYIDFRLNEARSLPREVQNEIENSTSNLKKISFLTAVPISTGLSLNDIALHKLRVLERQTWERYLDDLPPHMMVYHWRRTVRPDEKGISDFSAFVKFAARRSGKGILYLYLLIFFIISVASGWTAARIDANFGPPYIWLSTISAYRADLMNAKAD